MRTLDFLKKLQNNSNLTMEDKQKLDIIINNLNKKIGLIWDEKIDKIDKEILYKQPIFLGEYKNKNLLIDGDNTISLELLKKTHKGKVDLIFIDPPYNTGNKDFFYNDDYVDKSDGFKHSKWLSFMKVRLIKARQLLSDNGMIFISIDHRESAYLKILMDEIFGEVNFVREIIWKMGSPSGFKTVANNLIRSHETILFYSKRRDAIKEIFNKIYLPYSNEYIRNSFKKETHSGRFFRKRGDKISYLDEMKGVSLSDVWDDIPSLQTTTQSPEVKEVKKIIGKNYDGQKPVKLLKRIVSLHSNKNAVVLDFFAGSGTTAIAVDELNKEDGGTRSFILCDQKDATNGVFTSYERLKNKVNFSLLNAQIQSSDFELINSSEILALIYNDMNKKIKFTKEVDDFDNALLPDFFYDY